MFGRIERGQVFFVSLDPAFGSELAGFKLRPIVVVSINGIQDKLPIVIVVPGTSDKHGKKSFPNEVIVQPSGSNGLKNETAFQCHQVRAISSGRIVSRSVGRLQKEDMERLESALRFTMGLAIDPRS